MIVGPIFSLETAFSVQTTAKTDDSKFRLEARLSGQKRGPASLHVGIPIHSRPRGTEPQATSPSPARRNAQHRLDGFCLARGYAVRDARRACICSSARAAVLRTFSFLSFRALKRAGLHSSLRLVLVLPAVFGMAALLRTVVLPAARPGTGEIGLLINTILFS